MKIVDELINSGEYTRSTVDDTFIKAIKVLGWDSIHDPVRGWWVVDLGRKVHVNHFEKIPYKEYSFDEFLESKKKLSERRDQRMEKYNPKLVKTALIAALKKVVQASSDKVVNKSSF